MTRSIVRTLALLRSSLALAAFLFVIGATRAVTQRAVATADVNVRPTPSAATTPLRTLTVGDTVQVLSPVASHGYLRVRTEDDRTSGWVYRRYLELTDTASAAESVTVASTTNDAPADYHNCAVGGDPNPNGSEYQQVSALNELKNRYHAPNDAQVDSVVTLARMLERGDDTDRFDENHGAVIEGWVDRVRVGGIETVNCHARAAKYRDTHIEVSLNNGEGETRRVIVEVTPRWRAALASHGVDWSTHALQQLLTGKRVQFRGWLLFDREHVAQAENTNPGNATDWRATVWEIHPVTQIVVLGN